MGLKFSSSAIVIWFEPAELLNGEEWNTVSDVARRRLEWGVFNQQSGEFQPDLKRRANFRPRSKSGACRYFELEWHRTCCSRSPHELRHCEKLVGSFRPGCAHG
jgi:hypothetical protein